MVAGAGAVVEVVGAVVVVVVDRLGSVVVGLAVVAVVSTGMRSAASSATSRCEVPPQPASRIAAPDTHHRQLRVVRFVPI